jgi:hypothetical protein
MKKALSFLLSLTCLFCLTLLFAPKAQAADNCPQYCSILPNGCQIEACKFCDHCPSKPEPTSFFGQVAKPQGIAKYGDFQTGLVKFTNVLLKLIIGVAGLFAFFNIIIAGYTFMGAGGDPKKVEQAWAKIWQSLLGLLFVAGSFVLAAIFGWLIFGDARAILVPTIYGP